MGFYTLEGEPLVRYLERLNRLVGVVRCSGYYPSMEAFLGALHLWEPCLAPAVNRTLPVDDRSDLPAESAFTRLLNEQRLFHRESALGAASLRKLRSPYYALLDTLSFPRLFDLSVLLAGRTDGGRAVRFRAILDRFDLSEGVLARYTVDFTHRETLWTPSLLALDEGVSRVSELLRNALSTACQDEAEFATIILSRLPGVHIERLIRGRLGPLWHKGKPLPEAVARLLEGVDGALMLHLPLDGVFSDLPDDVNLDPFAGLYRGVLSTSSSEVMERLAARLGYRVLKERRVILSVPSNDAEVTAQLAKKCPSLIIMGPEQGANP